MIFSDTFKITTAAAPDAAATGDITGATLDMAGYDGVIVICQLGAIVSGAVSSIKWQSGAASNMSDAADLADTGITIADNDDDQIFWSELIRPPERYVRAIISNATQNITQSAIYIQFMKKGKFPVDNNVDDTITGEVHIEPEEGTA